MTAAAVIGHSSSCEATDRCTFGSDHSAAMGRTRYRVTPSRQGDRVFSTHSRQPDQVNLSPKVDIYSSLKQRRNGLAGICFLPLACGRSGLNFRTMLFLRTYSPRGESCRVN